MAKPTWPPMPQGGMGYLGKAAGGFLPAVKATQYQDLAIGFDSLRSDPCSYCALPKSDWITITSQAGQQVHFAGCVDCFVKLLQQQDVKGSEASAFDLRGTLDIIRGARRALTEPVSPGEVELAIDDLDAAIRYLSDKVS